MQRCRHSVPRQLYVRLRAFPGRQYGPCNSCHRRNEGCIPRRTRFAPVRIIVVRVFEVKVRPRIGLLAVTPGTRAPSRPSMLRVPQHERERSVGGAYPTAKGLALFPIPGRRRPLTRRTPALASARPSATPATLGSLGLCASFSLLRPTRSRGRRRCTRRQTGRRRRLAGRWFDRAATTEYTHLPSRRRHRPARGRRPLALGARSSLRPLCPCDALRR